MKRKLSLVIAICIICTLLTVPISANEFFYGMVKDKAYVQGIGKSFVEILVYNSNGESFAYSCERLLINGTLYNDSSAIDEAIICDSFIKYTLQEDGKSIAELFIDSEPNIVLNDVAYNSSKGAFEGVNELPVFFTHNNNVCKPYLDEEHLYNIEVYDYAINIVDFYATNGRETIKNIDISTGINGKYERYIDVYCDFENINCILNVEIFDEENKSLRKQKSDLFEISFGEFENKDCSYNIKVWLEDKNGATVSPVYLIGFEDKEIPIYTGVIKDKAINYQGIGKDFVEILVCDNNNKEYIYKCSNNIWINKYKYKNSQEILDAIPLNAETDFVVLDEEVTVIGFDDRVKPSFNTCKVENGTFTAEIKTENVLFDFHFMLAIYNSDGALVKIVWESISAQEAGKTISFAADAKYKDYTVKVLAWHKTRLSSASDVIFSGVEVK